MQKVFLERCNSMASSWFGLNALWVSFHVQFYLEICFSCCDVVATLQAGEQVALMTGSRPPVNFEVEFRERSLGRRMLRPALLLRQLRSQPLESA